MEEKQDYLSSVFEQEESLLSYKINSIRSFKSSKTFIVDLNQPSETLEFQEFFMKDFLNPIYQSNAIALNNFPQAKAEKIKNSADLKQRSNNRKGRKKTNKKRYTQDPQKKYRFLKKVAKASSQISFLYEQFVIAFSEINGYGYLLLQDGRIMQGEFTYGFPLGKISIKFPNGVSYKGAAYEFRPHGFGQMRLPNGNRFVGEFSNGQPHGQGIHYAKNGSIKSRGEWRHGKLIT